MNGLSPYENLQPNEFSEEQQYNSFRKEVERKRSKTLH